MITITSSPSGKVFSSDIPDLQFTVSDTVATVSIAVNGEYVYNETLVPMGGKVTIDSLSSMLEVYAERWLVLAVTVTIREPIASDSKSLDFMVLFSRADVGVAASEFYENYFLSVLLGPKMTAMGRLEYLHYYGTEVPNCIATYDDGTTGSFTPTITAGNSRYTQIDVSPDSFTSAGKQLISYEVTAGSRRQQFLIDLSQPDCAPILLFDNSFGVQELIYCTGIHKVSPSYKRQSARFGGLLRNYDIEETRSFQADTGVLTTAMANWADELLRSKEIYVVNIYGGVANVGKEVLITDSKSEYTNDDAELPRFTFTYQYAQRLHNVLQLQREGRIFDNTFDNTFN
ncbi:MAG: hypothetical protein ACOCNE_00255 [Prevotella pectinovora]